ncbi:penicillin-binding protein 1A [Wenzhouxiangella sp. AB-CW3]|uniref:penicillin-binding protein 1A n=1 Tax=Wenzhouxiangella sp. AB-CW3 TaxID=2771012 RepID=UPI00168BEB49|nr:penicillin-binding protein 1A [Wenzhouxiangella sp. AB-CW3]QOC21859.1 penicillin-binding protein 1A [Wenzhouxiangella sp. AB-CW3]
MLALGAIGVLVLWLTIVPTLPSVESLRDVRLQVPLRVYSEDDQLMAEIGEQRRLPIALEDMPEHLKRAFLAAEDDRFYSHPGIDWRGTVRGAWLYARSMGRGRVPGGSTITQQVARRFFLSTDYSITRKLREMLLAIKIERELSKDEIFELYLNKEFLGHRAYGVGAAAQVYYGKRLDELTLAEAAMIAALPKAPSRDNPLSGPRQAMIRRNWILDRMLGLGYIDEQAHAEARSEPNSARYHGPVVALNAPWVTEMVRRDVVGRFGAEEAYSGGYSAWTTVDSRLQRAADQAVRDGLQAYDRRHGWRGAEQRIAEELLEDEEALRTELDRVRAVADLQPAVVVQADDESARLVLRGGEAVELTLDDVTWARPFISADTVGARPEAVSDVVSPGDLVRLRLVDDQWRLAQIPQAEAALVSMDAETGAVVAMVGGLDFGRSQFNRVTQSRRQPGSAFKPFIYAAALDHGFTAASMVNDSPVVLDDPSMEREWRPTNFSRRFHGPTRLRDAMIHSRNLVSVRLLMDMGLDYARDYITDFGFERNELPNGPSMALGSASLTPMSMTAAYAVFANGGYAVEPRYLHSVVDGDGRIVMEPEWTTVCRNCPDIPPAPQPVAEEESEAQSTLPRLRRPTLNGDRADPTALEENPALAGPPRPNRAPSVLEPQTTWLIDSMLSDVVTGGTGRRALALNRSDLAGKTGTTNDLRDTWFAGYGGGLVTTVWLGMDDNQSLGRQEQGGRTALPLWVDFMAVALDDRPEHHQPMPVGLAQALINPETGRRVRPGTSGAVQEWFHADNMPPLEDADDARNDADPYDIF